MRDLATVPTLLTQDAPRIIPYVKRLDLLRHAGHRSFNRYAMVNGAHLLDVLHLFPALKRLHLFNFILSAPPCLDNRPLLKLNKLDYIVRSFYCREAPVKAFLWLLALFATVESLFIQGVGSVTPVGQEDDNFVPKALQVKHLRVVGSGCIRSFLQSIQHSPSTKSLESLYLERCRLQELQEIPKLINLLSIPLVNRV